eukprot:8979364-Pyramimonas_sp.AAC.1
MLPLFVQLSVSAPNARHIRRPEFGAQAVQTPLHDFSVTAEAEDAVLVRAEANRASGGLGVRWPSHYGGSASHVEQPHHTVVASCSDDFPVVVECNCIDGWRFSA